MKQKKKNGGALSSYLSRRWAEGKLAHIAPFLPSSGTILDIGSGTGAVSRILKERGYIVSSVDVQDRSLVPEDAPILYDGARLPFADSSFDSGLLLTVLHHTPNPVEVLCDAARVCRQIIIIEDVYTNPVQQHLTYFTDSLFNMEFRGHPHSNKTDSEWREAFQDLGLRLTHAEQRKVLLVFRQYAYSLTVPKRPAESYTAGPTA
ncbi:MAG: class I SAM-dependent methyltransferase [Spirochaetaceae bacterium]|nr:MAG: class I SAM-dependent methyltransferase [Spirochaetaceae bacterium]